MKRVIVRAVVGFVLLAILGQVVGLLLRRFFAHDADPYADEFDILNVMSGSELVSLADDLRAGSARTYLGGTEIDLRDAELAPGGAHLAIATYCGGTEIIVPPEWRVEVRGTPQAGGHEVNVTDPDDLPFDAPHLVIDATTICGGLEVWAKARGGADPARATAEEAMPSTNGAREPEAVARSD